MIVEPNDIQTIGANEPLAREPSRAEAADIRAITVRGMPLHVITLQQTVELIVSRVTEGKGGWVMTPNLDILRRYVLSDTFRTMTAASTLNVADGMPLVWASRLKGTPLPERVNGTELMCRLVQAAAGTGISVYLLGGTPGTAEKAAQMLCRENPGLVVAGWHCPPYGFENDINELAVIEAKLTAAKPDLIFVGLGSPKQDLVISALRLRFPSTWWFGVGVSFSFISGDLPRAPAWAQERGFEWLYRLCIEPRRLAKRYLLAGVPFFLATILISFIERLLTRKVK